MPLCQRSPQNNFLGHTKNYFWQKRSFSGHKKYLFGAQIKILRPLLQFKHSSSMRLRTPLTILRRPLALSTIFKMVISGARSNCDYLAMLGWGRKHNGCNNHLKMVVISTTKSTSSSFTYRLTNIDPVATGIIPPSQSPLRSPPFKYSTHVSHLGGDFFLPSSVSYSPSNISLPAWVKLKKE